MSRRRVTAASRRHLHPGLFLVSFLVLLLLGALLLALLWLLHSRLAAEPLIAVGMSCWAAAAVGFSVLMHHLVERNYERPLRAIGDAASKVADGDFSVFVPPMHTEDRYDYVDSMIHDFNRMVEELGSMETFRADFFSNVSHEFKTPLAAIQNSAELLRNEQLSPERRQELVGSINASSRRLSTLITNILRLSRLEKQTVVPPVEPYDVCSRIVECALCFEPVWEERKIEFEADFADEKRFLSFDAELLDLVWNNLLSNAFKYTEPGGTVTVSECSDRESITVRIRDSGCGMDGETQRHIFEKFYQGDTSHASEGNGLGLALAHRVVQLAGGSISAESTVGVGTEFTVRLPAVRKE